MKDQKESIDQRIQFNVLQNADLSRETIKQWLEKDIKGVYILLADILQSSEIMDAIVNVFYKRYQELHDSAKVSPELFTNGKEVDHAS